jgi:hypothetical protein
VGRELGIATLLLSETHEDPVTQEGNRLGKPLEEHLHEATEARSDGDDLPGDIFFGGGLGNRHSLPTLTPIVRFPN